ncbi:uncharacterized protein [Coffea arabica]|uniref:Uncharacterized protein n=1 Tax=Coffea arabica TaxID=13443 RepID=A0A6P6SNR2_COFAR|nr:uncharacterized protein LOC113693174 [Coffea arabica]
MEVRMALMVGILPIVGVLLWFWNDIWFAIPVRLRGVADGTELPAGYMGIPFLGEMCTFLWNVQNSPLGCTVHACFPSLNKLVLQSPALFSQQWPFAELLGTDSIIGCQGAEHARLKNFVVKAINKPDAPHRVALMVQPASLVPSDPGHKGSEL